MSYNPEEWIYECDEINHVRYVLGTVGNRPLLCFGINPSTATPDDLDNTLKSVQRLALNNGFDSWIMMNVYTQRATDPDNMHQLFNEEIHKNNLKFIENILSEKDATIWAAWGTLIEKRPYLKLCLLDIYNLSTNYNCDWVSIGNISKKGHPHHPLYLASSTQAKKFNIEEYIGLL
jgi:hypothetical protein